MLTANYCSEQHLCFYTFHQSWFGGSTIFFFSDLAWQKSTFFWFIDIADRRPLFVIGSWNLGAEVANAWCRRPRSRSGRRNKRDCKHLREERSENPSK